MAKTNIRAPIADVPKALRVHMLRQMISIRRFEEEVKRL